MRLKLATLGIALLLAWVQPAWAQGNRAAPYAPADAEVIKNCKLRQGCLWDRPYSSPRSIKRSSKSGTYARPLHNGKGVHPEKLSANPYDPDSTSNPYGQNGSPYSPDSIYNPYGAGSPYSIDSPNNPYESGMRIKPGGD